MRAIKKQTMIDLIIEAKRTDPETGSFAEWLAEYLAEHLPTLTPPNEPLTLEELDGWNTKPAYLVPLGDPIWAAQWSIMRYGRFAVETNAGPTMSICLSKSEYGKTWLAYRRPPEGESPHD